MKNGIYSDTISTELLNTLKSWKQTKPMGGVYAMVAEASRQDIKALQSACARFDLPLIGAMFPELIVNGEFKKHGVLLTCFNNMPAYRLFNRLSDPEQIEALTRQASELLTRNSSGQRHALFLIIDAMVPNIATILDKLYLELADQVNYIGVNAGSETFQPMPCLFDRASIVDDALLAIALPNHEGASLEHGYTVPDNLSTATATSGNRILTINWRPAFEVYAELALEHYGVRVNRENFYQQAVHFPFGIIRADGDVLVRIPVALEEDGSVFCVGEVPENAMLTLVQAEANKATDTVEIISKKMSPVKKDIITFYCAGRRMHKGADASSELQLLQTRLAPADVFGALSLGEIGNKQPGGYPMFHNATIVCSSWEN